MEGELWNGLYHLVQSVGKRHRRPARIRFSDACLLRVYLWAALHDRPVCWACQSKNWPPSERWRSLPSPATMSQRMRKLSFQQLLQAVIQELRPSEPGLCRRLDSKPLPVGGFSKDRDARRGYATGGIARGYKMCCLWGKGVVPDAWGLGPLNLSDAEAGAEVLRDLSGGGYLLADATYGVNWLAEQSGAQGLQLVAPRKKPERGLGHREHSAYRLRSIELLEGPSPFGRALYRDREQIERTYGQLTSFGGGLQPLPSWVRRPHRVAPWVAAKLLINAVRILRHQGVAA